MQIQTNLLLALNTDSVTIYANRRYAGILCILMSALALFLLIGYGETRRIDLLIPAIAFFCVSVVSAKFFINPPEQILLNDSQERLIFYLGGLFSNRILGKLSLDDLSSLRFERVRFGEYYSSCILLEMKSSRLTKSSSSQFVEYTRQQTTRTKYSEEFPVQICWRLNLPKADQVELFLSKVRTAKGGEAKMGSRD